MAKKMSWNRFSEEKLNQLEQQILSTLNSSYKTYYIPVKLESGTDERIWTIEFNTESQNVPLVLVHGFAAGIGFWCRNFDALSKDRPVYAMDLLGFGRSSRPTFSSDSLEAERQMVEGLEAWRKEMNLEKFYLLGHSLGGYLATSYAMLYPDRVLHLILADPWGFSDHLHEKLSFWDNLISIIFHIRSLEVVRALGPWGPWLIQTARSDIATKFEDVLEDKSIMPNYIYQCNAQSPTGERAFYKMIWGHGYAYNPMIHRMENLNPQIPITLMFGSDTWMDKSVGQKIQEMRPNSYVNVQIIDDTGHHLYSEQADAFNEVVLNACSSSDNKEIIYPMITKSTGNIIGELIEHVESTVDEKKEECIKETIRIETSLHERTNT